MWHPSAKSSVARNRSKGKSDGFCHHDHARHVDADGILDRAGWHTSSRLEVPHNITLLALPPRSPELNPVENLWQFLRDNWLSNRIFENYEDILDHCCHAWNNLVSQPERIASIGTRKWAHGF